MEHLKQETVSGAQLNIDALYQICPQCFTESKDPKTGEVRRSVDFDKLRLLLGDNVAEGDERYDFTWVGKRAALQEAAKPIRKTLRPCPEESVDWENTKNLYIEGDNLEVLKLLQNSYMGKVKMIYIDPPYNTGNDFVYHDDYFDDSYDEHNYNEDGERLFSRNQVTHDGKLIKNTDSNGRFHSDWCSMIYSRLMVARTLLQDDGIIFISIDDNEVENLKKISNEIFGEKATELYIWDVREDGTMPKTAKNTVRKEHEYILACFKSEYTKKLSKYSSQKHLNADWSNPDNDPRGGWMSANISRGSEGSTGGSKSFVITNPAGIKFDRDWSISKDEYEDLLKDNRIFFADNGRGVPRRKIFKTDVIQSIQSSLFEELKSSQSAAKYLKELLGAKCFDFPKTVELLYRLIQIGADKNSLILDFFSGSATTAHAVMQLNAEDGGSRKYIMVQLPEKTAEDSEAYKAGYKNICEIGKERIRRAGKKILEEQKAKQGDLFTGEQKKLDVGFRVFKCADSNMKDVYYAPADYDQQMLFDLEDNIKEDRNDLDLLFGCMLEWGVTLDLPLRTEKVDGVYIHIVNEGDLVACFEKHIPESVIDHIASLLPMRVVLRDSCFDEAKEKMNFFEIFKQRTGWSEEEVRKNVKVI